MCDARRTPKYSASWWTSASWSISAHRWAGEGITNSKLCCAEKQTVAEVKEWLPVDCDTREDRELGYQDVYLACNNTEFFSGRKLVQQYRLALQDVCLASVPMDHRDTCGPF